MSVPACTIWRTFTTRLLDPVLRVTYIYNFHRPTSVREKHVPIRISYVQYYTTKLGRKQAEVIYRSRYSD
jgi:hypothetical protein